MDLARKVGHFERILKSVDLDRKVGVIKPPKSTPKTKQDRLSKYIGPKLFNLARLGTPKRELNGREYKVPVFTYCNTEFQKVIYILFKLCVYVQTRLVSFLIGPTVECLCYIVCILSLIV